MKISCNIAADIMPLYADECCSEDTKKLIEEHVTECDTCREKLAKLKQPMFLEQEPRLTEESYAKHAKKAFGKLRRRWMVLVLAILLLMIPAVWLLINELRGDGISYSSLPYVLKANSLLGELEAGNYEKAFTNLKLEALYQSEIEFTETNLDSEYKEVTIGGDLYYVNEQIYLNDFQNYQIQEDEKAFWTSIYMGGTYMIPASKAEMYLKDDSLVEWQNFMEYPIKETNYYIEGNCFNYTVDAVGSYVFDIMPEEYYDMVKSNIKETEEDVKEIIAKISNMGYEGYVSSYEQQWIKNFEELKSKGITIIGYKPTMISRLEWGYQLNYQLKLNVNGEILNDYGVIFAAKKDGFYPIGGTVSEAAMETDSVPIINAFQHSLNAE